MELLKYWTVTKKINFFGKKHKNQTVKNARNDSVRPSILEIILVQNWLQI